MWTAQEFADVLESYPDGGTLWTRTKRMVRYIRVFRSEDTVVAVMTEQWGWRSEKKVGVELFVKTPSGTAVAEFHDPQKTAEFSKSLIESSILGLVSPGLLDKVKTFVAVPNKTYLYTW